MNPTTITTHDDIPIVLHNIVDRWNRHYRYAVREDAKGSIEGLRVQFDTRGMVSNTENYRNGCTYGIWYTYWDTGILMEQETMSRPKRKTYFIVKRNYDDTNKYIMYPEYLTEF
jgi:hypothetical protein